MLIGVTGDTHNNIKSISKICSIFNELEVSQVIHTGDVTLPKSLIAFSNLNMPLIGVFGNNDQEEKEDLIKTAKAFDCSFYDEPYFFKVNNIKIFIFHHPNLIENYHINNADFIVHGHTHRYRLEKNDGATIFNPGECAGIMKGKNKIGIINTSQNTIETISF